MSTKLSKRVESRKRVRDESRKRVRDENVAALDPTAPAPLGYVDPEQYFGSADNAADDEGSQQKVAKDAKTDGEPTISQETPDVLAAVSDSLGIPPECLAPVNLMLCLPPLAAAQQTGYRQRHLDAQLSGPQAAALRRLFDTLDDAGVRLAGGKRIVRPVDAIRWLLEQVGEAMQKSE